jgi:hypothetical protein
LCEDGHVSAHGRLMMGNNAFFCYLSGSINWPQADRFRPFRPE